MRQMSLPNYYMDYFTKCMADGMVEIRTGTSNQRVRRFFLESAVEHFQIVHYTSVGNCMRIILAKMGAV